MRRHMIWMGPLAGVLFGLALHALGFASPAAITAGITLLTVIWWVSEPVPIAVTSLVPFALLPIFGIADHKTMASALGSHVIVLLMGAFMLAKAIEKSGAHKRLAFYMIRLVGTHSARRLVFGFMMATAILSMWISNTATSLIMLPIAMAVMGTVDNPKLKTALVLGIAYAASVGGIGTPIGTTPNVIFLGIYEEVTGREFSFLQWMKIGVPIVVVAIPVMALWLTRSVTLTQPISPPTLGRWRPEERRTLIIFGLTALAWITRTAPFGGWSTLLGNAHIGDSTIALFAVIIMCITPNGEKGRYRGQVLDWETARDIPWGLLLLFAGGIALSKGITASGLSTMLADSLSGLSNLPILGLVLVICLVVTYLTEITSNTATATLLMPILAIVGVAAKIDPAVLMVPAAMAASCAFMLPVATAPNAIAYGLGGIKITDMVREGAVLSLALSLIIALVCGYFLA